MQTGAVPPNLRRDWLPSQPRRAIVGDVIFAAADYACYRMRLGHYRPTAIESAGWKLASFGNFGDDRQPRPADILVFHHVDSSLSWVVMYVTNSLASHAATMVDDGDLVEATVSGTLRHPFRDVLDGQSYLVAGAPRTLTEEQRAKIVAAINSLIGTPYGWYSAGRLGLRHLVGARYAPSNLRLYADAILTLLAAGWLLGRRHPRWQLVPAAWYLGIVSANRLSERERLLQSTTATT